MDALPFSLRFHFLKGAAPGIPESESTRYSKDCISFRHQAVSGMPESISPLSPCSETSFASLASMAIAVTRRI